MQIIEIDGGQFNNLEEFFIHFAKQAGIAGWGNNLDAFNDVLRGGFGTPEGSIIFRWKNHTLSRVLLGYKETVRQLELHHLNCHPSNRFQVAQELIEAKK